MSKKYVAFLDVLGFKDLVSNNSDAKLREIYEKLLRPIVDVSLSGMNAKKGFEENGCPKFIIEPSTFHKNINSLIVSDSVILWTPDTSIQSFIDITLTSCSMLMNGIVTGLPMRGAITAGNLTRLSHKYETNTDNVTETLFGKSLVDAYELEGSQQWSGCVVANSAIEEFKEQCLEHDLSIDVLIKSGLIKEYDVPTKQGYSRQYILNWTIHDKNWGKLSEIMIRESFNKWNKTLNSSAEEKRDNTVAFFKEMKN